MLMVCLLAIPFALADVSLSDCGEINESGDYLLTGTVISENSCFNILADNVKINCGGHSITYGTSGEGYPNGIYTENDNLVVENCLFIDGSDVGTSRDAIELVNSQGHSVDSNEFDLISNQARAVRLTNVDNTEIINNEVTSNNRGGRGFSVSTGSDEVNTGLIIESNIVTTSGEAYAYGMNIQETEDSVIRNNHFTTSGSIDCYPLALLGGLEDNSFEGNVLVSLVEGIKIDASYGENVFDDNIFKNNDFEGILQTGSLEGSNKLLYQQGKGKVSWSSDDLSTDLALSLDRFRFEDNLVEIMDYPYSGQATISIENAVSDSLRLDGATCLGCSILSFSSGVLTAIVNSAGSYTTVTSRAVDPRIPMLENKLENYLTKLLRYKELKGQYYNKYKDSRNDWKDLKSDKASRKEIRKAKAKMDNYKAKYLKYRNLVNNYNQKVSQVKKELRSLK